MSLSPSLGSFLGLEAGQVQPNIPSRTVSLSPLFCPSFCLCQCAPLLPCISPSPPLRVSLPLHLSLFSLLGSLLSLSASFYLCSHVSPRRPVGPSLRRLRLRSLSSLHAASPLLSITPGLFSLLAGPALLRPFLPPSPIFSLSPSLSRLPYAFLSRSPFRGGISETVAGIFCAICPSRLCHWEQRHVLRGVGPNLQAKPT